MSYTHGTSLFIDSLPPVVKQAIVDLAADNNQTLKATATDLLINGLAQRKRVHRDEHGNIFAGPKPPLTPVAKVSKDAR